MLHFGLIGEKLGHSLSAPIHQAVWEKIGIEADYRLIEIPRDQLTEKATELLEKLNGFNITIPYKQEIMPLLSSVDPFARGVGAVNTVRCDERRGYNTDAPGFQAMLRYHGIDPAGKACFILGTGGAAKAVRTALTEMGAEKVTMVSRHPCDTEIGYEALTEAFSGILVNCTPAGMWPKTDGCPVAEETLAKILPRASGVADVIYNPPETCLTRAAKQAGIPACTGLYMLIAQAVTAEEIWLGRKLPPELCGTLMKELKLL